MNKKLEWVKEHKKEILIGVASLTGTAVLTIIGVKCLQHRNTKSGFDNAANDIYGIITKKNVTECEKMIDEHFFTAFAPAIEDAIFDKGLDNFVDEVTYDICEDLAKVVTVTVNKVVKE